MAERRKLTLGEYFLLNQPGPLFLAEVDLSYTTMPGVNLSGANLYYANLAGAYLRGANLSNADLTIASLEGANLSGADLHGAYLEEVGMTGVDLSGANLSDADLQSVDGLSKANLHGARYTKNTKWPPGFDPEAAGAIFADV